VRWGTSAQRANRPELDSGDGGCGCVGIRERACDLDQYREHCVSDAVECVHRESGQSSARPEGGGVWARGVGGHLSTSTTSTTGNISFGGPVSGGIACNARTREDFTGVQIGSDFARLNLNGWNLHLGSTVGYLGANTQDGTPSGLNPGPPTFHDSLQIPFVGAYVAASFGGFLVDGQVRGDFFENEVSDDNHGLLGQHFNARGISVTGNVAYNHIFPTF
jgi:outer membrane autotransporter protein